MKKAISLLLCLALAAALLAGCASKTNQLAEAYEVFGMKPKELSKVEIIRQDTMELKTVDKTKDIGKILDVFSHVEQLENVKPDLAAFSSSYVLQFYSADGAQLLTASYAQEDKSACLFAAGDPYAVDPIDFDGLWDKLDYETVPASVQNPLGLDYLEMSEGDLSGRYGSESVLGYIGTLTTLRAGVDVVERKADSASAAGYVITGEGDGVETYRLAKDCEFWVLEDHWYVACRVSYDDLQKYMKKTDYAMLWTLYLKDGEVAAIAETYTP
jgi:hypothetical protein